MLTRRRIIIFSIVSIVFIVGFVIFSFINSYKQSEAFATNIRFADSQSDKVKFFTGSNFAELNVSTGKTSSSSPILILPPVTQMEWGKNGVLFSATDYSPIDDLYSILNSKKMPTNDSYWWLYSLSSNKFQPLIDPEFNRPANDVQWINDNEFIYMALPAESDVKKLNTDFYLRDNSGKEEKVLSFDAKDSDEVAKIISASRNAVFVTIQSEQGFRLSKIEFSTGKESVIEKEINREVAVSPDGNTYIYSKLNTKINFDSEVATLSDIYYFNGKDRKKISTGFNGVSRWDKRINSFITYGEDSKGNNEVIITSKNSNKEINLEKTVDKGLTINSVVVNFGIDDLLLVDESNNIFHYSKKAYNNVPKLQDDSNLRGDFAEDGFNINYYLDENGYNVYVMKNPFSVNSKKALDFIVNKNLDPNQLNLRWYAIDNVDRKN